MNWDNSSTCSFGWYNLYLSKSIPCIIHVLNFHMLKISSGHLFSSLPWTGYNLCKYNNLAYLRTFSCFASLYLPSCSSSAKFHACLFYIFSMLHCYWFSFFFVIHIHYLLSAIINFEHQILCGAEEILNERLLLTGAQPCQNPQCLRVMEMAKLSHGPCMDVVSMHRKYQLQLPFPGYLHPVTAPYRD